MTLDEAQRQIINNARWCESFCGMADEAERFGMHNIAMRARRGAEDESTLAFQLARESSSDPFRAVMDSFDPLSCDADWLAWCNEWDAKHPGGTK